MEGIIPRDWNNCNGNCSNATKDYSFDYNLHPRTLRRQTNVAIKHSLSFEGSRIFQSEDKMKTRLNTKFHFFRCRFHSNSFHRGRTECTINTGTSLPVVRSENLAAKVEKAACLDAVARPSPTPSTGYRSCRNLVNILPRCFSPRLET